MISEVEERMRRLQEEAIISKLSGGIYQYIIILKELGEKEFSDVCLEWWSEHLKLMDDFLCNNDSALILQRVTQERESIVGQSSSYWRNERSRCL